jgi:hypothetical protein
MGRSGVGGRKASTSTNNRNVVRGCSALLLLSWLCERAAAAAALLPEFSVDRSITRRTHRFDGTDKAGSKPPQVQPSILQEWLERGPAFRFGLGGRGSRVHHHRPGWPPPSRGEERKWEPPDHPSMLLIFLFPHHTQHIAQNHQFRRLLLLGKESARPFKGASSSATEACVWGWSVAGMCGDRREGAMLSSQRRLAAWRLRPKAALQQASAGGWLYVLARVASRSMPWTRAFVASRRLVSSAALSSSSSSDAAAAGLTAPCLLITTNPQEREAPPPNPSPWYVCLDAGIHEGGWGKPTIDLTERPSPAQASLLTLPPSFLPSPFSPTRQTKGTSSFGKRHTKTHTGCRRCGRITFHKQKKVSKAEPTRPARGELRSIE